MKTPQIKTLELLIVHALEKERSAPGKVCSAFERMRAHFSDEDYLHAFGHGNTISEIYLNDVYKQKTLAAFARALKLDSKTLLEYRKSYIRLFAKYYLNLNANPDNVWSMLYSALKENAALPNNFSERTSA